MHGQACKLRVVFALVVHIVRLSSHDVVTSVGTVCHFGVAITVLNTIIVLITADAAIRYCTMNPESVRRILQTATYG